MIENGGLEGLEFNMETATNEEEIETNTISMPRIEAHPNLETQNLEIPSNEEDCQNGGRSDGSPAQHSVQVVQSDSGLAKETTTVLAQRAIVPIGSSSHRDARGPRLTELGSGTSTHDTVAQRPQMDPRANPHPRIVNLPSSVQADQTSLASQPEPPDGGQPSRAGPNRGLRGGPISHLSKPRAQSPTIVQIRSPKSREQAC